MRDFDKVDLYYVIEGLDGMLLVQVAELTSDGFRSFSPKAGFYDHSSI
jgi:hypothetical protein